MGCTIPCDYPTEAHSLQTYLMCIIKQTWCISSPSGVYYGQDNVAKEYLHNLHLKIKNTIGMKS